MGVFVMKKLLCLALFIPQILFGTTFMPDNDLHKYDSLLGSNITKEQFNQVLNEVDKIYRPILKVFGKELVISRKWADKTVNAQAWQTGNTWYIEFFGGLARRPEIDLDGFTIVVCHELGHHLGGFPKYGTSWAAAEGQSDYFSTQACTKKLWANDFAQNVAAGLALDPYAKQLCDDYQTEVDDAAICYRSLAAAKGLAALLGQGEQVDYDTPDPRRVSRTNSSYPDTTQCRFDTYIAGALCDEVWSDTLIPKTEVQSSYYLCTRKHNYARQARPLCWFKPYYLYK